jgi:hypothetical protein
LANHHAYTVLANQRLANCRSANRRLANWQDPEAFLGTVTEKYELLVNATGSKQGEV